MAARPFHLTRSARARVAPVLAVFVVALVAAAAVVVAPASATTSEDYLFISGIGPTYAAGHSFGAGGAGPNGIATDSAGNIYVTLPAGFAKFNAAGAWICDYTGDNGYVTGSGYGIDVDRDGDVYFADRTNHWIAKIHPYAYGVNGNTYNVVSLTGKAGGGGNGDVGTGDGQFDFPNDVAVDGHYLYVTDMLNDRIQKFETATGDDSLSWRATWGSSGNENGKFSSPRGIAADGVGHIFVADTGNRRVQELTRDGAFVGKFGSTSASDPLYFLDPIGIDVDGAGDVYVTDLGDATSWVGKFRPSGATYALVTRIGSFGTADDHFYYPWSSAVAPNGYIYVTDTQNHKVKKFARDATPPTVRRAGFPIGWTKTVGDPELLATDPTVVGQYTSGGVHTYWSLTSGTTWRTYLEPFASGDFVEGDNAVTYYAEDAVGNTSPADTVHVYYDKTAPVTDVWGAASGWHTTDVSVTLTPQSDGLSPIASTEYRVQGATTWTTYGGPFTVTAEGATVYEFRSTDSAGNVEAVKAFTVHVDKTPPTTTASGVTTGWSKTPVVVTLAPGAGGPTPVVSTEYRIQGATTWTTYTGAFTITAQGTTVYEYRSSDEAGNCEGTKTLTVRIDSVPPTPKAITNKSVKRTKTVKLPYRVDDPASPQAQAVIKIYRGKALKKTLAVGTKATNANLTYSYTCKLPKGKYTWKVYATDLAGNVQLKPAVKTLTVK